MRENACGNRRHQSRLRGGQGLRRVHAFARHRAGKAVGFIQQLQHRRNHECADDTADNQRHLLPPRRRLHQITRFQILQIVIRNRSHRDNGRTAKQRQREQELTVGLVRHQTVRLAHQQQHQRNRHNRHNPHARNRAGRRTDQACHITAGGGNQKADDGSQKRTHNHQQPCHAAGNVRIADKVVERYAQNQHHGQHPENHGLGR